MNENFHFPVWIFLLCKDENLYFLSFSPSHPSPHKSIIIKSERSHCCNWDLHILPRFAFFSYAFILLIFFNLFSCFLLLVPIDIQRRNHKSKRLKSVYSYVFFHAFWLSGWSCTRKGWKGLQMSKRRLKRDVDEFSCNSLRFPFSSPSLLTENPVVHNLESQNTQIKRASRQGEHFKPPRP